MGNFIGCDLGGTNLRAAIVNSQTGTVSNLTIVPTLAREGYEEVLLRMVDLFEHLIQESGLGKMNIDGIGIGIPGMMDVERGYTTFVTNLPGHWINIPVGPFITERIGIPTFILNDVRSITWGEYEFGAGKGCNSMVMYAIGTGIGGGVVIGAGEFRAGRRNRSYDRRTQRHALQLRKPRMLGAICIRSRHSSRRSESNRARRDDDFGRDGRLRLEQDDTGSGLQRCVEG